MEVFDANWLALREAVDHRSRATTLLMPLQAAVAFAAAALELAKD